MKVRGLLIQRDGERCEARRHEGRVVVAAATPANVLMARDRIRQGPCRVRPGFCNCGAMGHRCRQMALRRGRPTLMVPAIEHRHGGQIACLRQWSRSPMRQQRFPRYICGFPTTSAPCRTRPQQPFTIERHSHALCREQPIIDMHPGDGVGGQLAPRGKSPLKTSCVS
jgi:hypothetical protein